MCSKSLIKLIFSLKLKSKLLLIFLKFFLIITHYQRLLDYIKPDFVHVLSKGKIVKTGCADLGQELEKTGYENLK